jgi:hypothetical protein
MITFKEFLENMATQTQKPTLKAGGGGIDDNDSNYGDDGDDEDWEWDKLARFDKQLIEWTNTSPFSRKIKNKILEMIFKTKPEIDFKEYLPDDESDESDFAPNGEIVISVDWKFPEQTIEDKMPATLRMGDSDLWKPLGIKPEELWHTLDKGDLAEYVWYHLKASIIGQNIEYDAKHYHPDKPEGQKFDPQYFGLQSKWKEDKPTLEKYTKFTLYEMAGEIENKAMEFIPFETTIKKTRERVQALVWQKHFKASAYITYRYTKS